MNIYTKHLLLVFVLTFCSCISNTEYTNVEDFSVSQEKSVSLSFSNQLQTRDGTQVDMLASVYVLAFKTVDNGLLSYISPAEKQADGTYRVSLWTSVNSSDTYKLVVLGNVTPSPAFIGKTLAQIQGELFKTVSSKEDLVAPCYFGTIAQGRDLVISDASTNLRSDLLRSLAQVQLGIGSFQSGAWDGKDKTGTLIPFALEEVYIFRPNSEQACIPEASGFVYGSDGLPSIVRASSRGDKIPQNNFEKFKYNSITNNGILNMFIPEATLGGTVNDSNHTNRMAVVLGGKYNSSKITTYYRVDFEKTAALIEGILRNHIYRFNIKNVSKNGALTPEKAYESIATLEFETELIPWGKGVEVSIDEDLGFSFRLD